MKNDRDRLDEQIQYYRARAPEYDQWHRREGRYDHGETHKRQWFAELGIVRSALESARPFGDCLELACGTGQWTPQLAGGSRHLTAVDVSQETIAINRAANASSKIDWVTADLFKWQPDRSYDFIFFGFWLSHIPLPRLAGFWSTLDRALRPGGRVFFVDGLPVQETTASDHAPLGDTGVTERKLNDGRIFHIVKVFHTPDTLTAELRQWGWAADLQVTGDFFYYGSACRPDAKGTQ